MLFCPYLSCQLFLVSRSESENEDKETFSGFVKSFNSTRTMAMFDVNPPGILIDVEASKFGFR